MSSYPLSPSPPADRLANARFTQLVAMGLMLAAGAFLFEHSFSGAAIKGIEDEQEVLDEYADRTQSGGARRKVVIFSFAAAGAVLLLRKDGNRWRPYLPLVVSAAALLAWATCSIVWSQMPAVSFRRLGLTVCAVLGAIGFARGLTLREITMATVVALVSVTGLSLLVQCAYGSFPLQGDYRFGGTIQPNIQSLYCAMLALCAWPHVINGRDAGLWRLIWAIAMVLVVLTGSRTGLGATLVALVAMLLYNRPAAERALSIGLLVAVLGGGLLISATADGPMRRSLFRAAAMGRTTEVTTGTGRLPLWQNLMQYVEDRPLQGYGYEAFWTEGVMKTMLKDEDWAAQHAHNAYLEATLQIGLVGLGLLVLTGLTALAAIAHYGKISGDPCAAYLFGAIIYLAVASMAESYATKTYFPIILLMMGVASIGCFGQPDGDRPPASAAEGAYA